MLGLAINASGHLPGPEPERTGPHRLSKVVKVTIGSVPVPAGTLAGLSKIRSMSAAWFASIQGRQVDPDVVPAFRPGEV